MYVMLLMNVCNVCWIFVFVMLLVNPPLCSQHNILYDSGMATSKSWIFFICFAGKHCSQTDLCSCTIAPSSVFSKVGAIKKKYSSPLHCAFENISPWESFSVAEIWTFWIGAWWRYGSLFSFSFLCLYVHLSLSLSLSLWHFRNGVHFQTGRRGFFLPFT